MKYALFSFLLTCLAITSFSQDKADLQKTAKQFYTEMGGAGVMFSANFDTRFNKSSNFGLGTRIGIGFTIKDEDVTDPNTGFYTTHVRTIPTLPFGLNYLFGKNGSPHTFEVGGGATYLFQKVALLNYDGHRKQSYFMGYFSFMYRRQPVNDGFTWRIGFTPLINTAGDIVPFAAAGIGFAFR